MQEPMLGASQDTTLGIRGLLKTQSGGLSGWRGKSDIMEEITNSMLSMSRIPDLLERQKCPPAFLYSLLPTQGRGEGFAEGATRLTSRSLGGESPVSNEEQGSTQTLSISLCSVPVRALPPRHRPPAAPWQPEEP